MARRGVGPVLVVTDGRTQRQSFREDRWMGEGRGEAGVGVAQWLEAEAVMRLEMGSELRRGEERKKGEAALGDKGSKA